MMKENSDLTEDITNCLVCLMGTTVPEEQRQLVYDFLVHTRMHDLLYRSAEAGAVCPKCHGPLPLGRDSKGRDRNCRLI